MNQDYFTAMRAEQHRADLLADARRCDDRRRAKGAAGLTWRRAPRRTAPSRPRAIAVTVRHVPDAL